LRERLVGNALAEVKRFDWDRAADEFLGRLYAYAGVARVQQR
jgi:hypothetical protein